MFLRDVGSPDFDFFKLKIIGSEVTHKQSQN